jgi:hypothetical protein
VTSQFGSDGDDRGPVRVETVVIGAGQAGLATGHHLARRGREFVILDAYQRVGDNWRCHWDSLRLYSPARAAALPGMRFPAPPASYPAKDQMADFLETYASTFELPVRTGVRVSRVAREDGGYLVATDGPAFRCDSVVVASGTFGRTPSVPDFAGELDPAILQLHSSAYKNPTQLRPGGVLVVGASHSGGDIAYEAGTAGHPTVLSGRIHGQVPFDIEGRPAQVIFPVLFLVAKHLLTPRTPLGRKLRPEVRRHGGPLIRVKRADLTGQVWNSPRRAPSGSATAARCSRTAEWSTCQRRVVHRLPAGLLLDRPPGDRRRRLAAGDPRCGGVLAGAVLRRPGVPVRLRVNARRRRRPGRRVRRQAPVRPAAGSPAGGQGAERGLTAGRS